MNSFNFNSDEFKKQVLESPVPFKPSPGLKEAYRKAPTVNLAEKLGKRYAIFK